MKKLLANILEPGSEQESGSEQGSGLETEPQSESGLWPSPKKEEESDVDPGQKEEIIRLSAHLHLKIILNRNVNHAV